MRTLKKLPFGEAAPFFAERALPLHAMLGSVGHMRETRASYDWHGLKRGRAEFALFQYTLSGAGRLRVGSVETDVLPGTAMLLNFPADNRYWLPAGSDGWEFIYVCLHGREVMRLWHFFARSLGPHVAFAAGAPAVMCMARIVSAALKNEIPTPFAASALAYEITVTLAAEARQAGKQESPPMTRAMAYGRDHLAKPLTVDDLAQVAGYSRFHFSRLFLEQAGLSPAAWLVEQRIKEAARLLRSTSHPLKEIAARCGFPDPNYLGKVFQRHTGIPPATYRRSGA